VKPRSDIDLLMTGCRIAGRSGAVWCALMVDVLDVSALPGSTAHMRALEATIVMRGDMAT
jgi:streptomycin 3"-adenylyltransferase